MVRAMRVAGARASNVVRRRQRDEQRVQGLLDGNPPREPKTVVAAADYQSWVIDACARGVIDARTAESLTKALRNLLIALKERDLQKKVEELTRQLAAVREGRGA
jgi:hypothetical protein